MAEESKFNAEVQRRLELIFQDRSELLRRFDFDGNGEIDDAEMNAIRHLISSEVLAEWSGDRSSPPQAPAPDLLGARYLPISELGRGTQGVTLLARDTRTNELVVIKEINIALIEDWKSLERFEREASVLKALRHTGIPTFIDAFSDGDTRYLVQEFIAGDTLASLIANGGMDERDVVTILAKMLEVLEYLHGCAPAILHRDIKPSNIIRTPDGRVVLVDFGAAKHHAAGTTVIGAAGYAAPEQLAGLPTPLSDLYGLGATMIHVITGQHPTVFESERNALKWREHTTINPYLAGMITRMVAPAPEDRWQSAVQLRNALTDLHSDLLEVSDPRDNAIKGLLERRPLNTSLRVNRDLGQVAIEIDTSTVAWLKASGLALGPFALMFIHPVFVVVGLLWLSVWFRHILDIVITDPRTIRFRSDGSFSISFGQAKASSLDPRSAPEVLSSIRVSADKIQKVKIKQRLWGFSTYVDTDNSTIEVARYLSLADAQWIADIINAYLERGNP